MHTAFRRPLPKHFTLPPKEYSKSTPQEDEAHIRHDRWQIAVRDDPWRHKLAETVAPYVLIDSNGDEDTTGNRLVAVNRIRRGDGG